MYNSEIWGNKTDGIRMKLLKTHVINCKIKQNVHGAIFIEGKLTEDLVKLYCDSAKTKDIKGKIYNDSGLLYPKIMLQDNILDLINDLRKKIKVAVLGKSENQNGDGKTNSCFGGRENSTGRMGSNKFSMCLSCKQKPSIA